jgi:hypothetical protein
MERLLSKSTKQGSDIASSAMVPPDRHAPAPDQGLDRRWPAFSGLVFPCVPNWSPRGDERRAAAAGLSIVEVPEPAAASRRRLAGLRQLAQRHARRCGHRTR